MPHVDGRGVSQFRRSTSGRSWHTLTLMRIKLTSIMVDDQDKALKFYTDIFGFVKKTEIPVGEYRWLTVVSPEGPDDLELSLEPNANPSGRTFQGGLFNQGSPLAPVQGEHMATQVP